MRSIPPRATLLATCDASPEAALRVFLTDEFYSKQHKAYLRKLGFVAYSHGSWSLSPAGHAEAVKLGVMDH